MLLESLTAQRLKSAFSERFYERGESYFLEKRVSDLEVSYRSNKNERVTAHVDGTENYAVRVEITGTMSKLKIHGKCECPVGVNCKHVIATLLQAISHAAAQQQDSPKTPRPAVRPAPMVSQKNNAVEHWLESLERSLTAPVIPIIDTDETYTLLYQLSVSSPFSPELHVQPILVRQLKKGGYGAPKRFNETSYAQSRFLTVQDKAIIAGLEVQNKLHGSGFYRNDYVLKDVGGEELLSELLETGRVCLLTDHNDFFKEGAERSSQIIWAIDDEGFQVARLAVEAELQNVFVVGNFWYIDHERQLIGKLTTDLEHAIASKMLSAPRIPPEYIEKVTKVLKRHEKIREVKAPIKFESIEVKAGIPVPCLHLSLATIRRQDSSYTISNHVMPVMALSFEYDGKRIPWTYEPDQLTQTQDKKLIRITRDRNLEDEAIDTLEKTDAELISMVSELARVNAPLMDTYFIDQNRIDPFNFSVHAIPELESAGWRIDMSEDYPYRVISDPIDEWYSTVEENSGVDWFGLELGVTIKGEKINLLPVLQKLIPQLRMMSKTEVNEMQSFMVQLPDKRYIALSADRIRQIFHVLIELYDHDSLHDNKQLRLSKWHAARLLELEKACGASNLRWIGGERLRQLGEKLTTFTRIEVVQPPKEFQGQLRGYQQEGLSWLQFLREYELGGILADDMGLGKTVQTIAHIQAEKSSGRMQEPVLVVAPTSLMYNWSMELQRFAPQLKVLTLHGAERSNQFEHINDYDVILTTYPLLVRDKDILLKQLFYIFILDEAQFIKNAKSQAAQVALQIKAEHRLCLTGTPMENHLGELWSLFHFMMPGFLGNEKTFMRVFRVPIEKNNDKDRRLHLNKRIAPFLLRRTKDKVVLELPAKIEMVRHAELDGTQRDLYETIRSTMHKKVRQEIAKSGLARSHIIILDALLKLRQVCCDPRLLKITSVREKTYHSAKLELLMSMLTEMLEEGRRILIFSQFAEMLGLIENELVAQSMPYVKLTGKTKDRQTPIQTFQAGQVPIFLISLKAGGTGLNLTAADTVIHYDPWWNPAVENQATDRAHRIGQDKVVFVYKLIAKGTVEEKMIEMQQKKSALMQSLFAEDQPAGLKLSEMDLQGLFDPLE